MIQVFVGIIREGTESAVAVLDGYIDILEKQACRWHGEILPNAENWTGIVPDTGRRHLPDGDSSPV